MNRGKLFEEEIKNSCESQSIFIWKIPDVYIPAKKVDRDVFIPQQPCDFVMAAYGKTWFIEAKSTNNKYITFQRTKEDKGMLQVHQWMSLLKFSRCDEVKCGFFVQFENETNPITLYWPVEGFLKFYMDSDKKSFNANDVMKYDGCIIIQELLKKKYRYDIRKWLNEEMKQGE